MVASSTFQGSCRDDLFGSRNLLLAISRLQSHVLRFLNIYVSTNKCTRPVCRSACDEWNTACIPGVARFRSSGTDGVEPICIYADQSSLHACIPFCIVPELKNSEEGQRVVQEYGFKVSLFACIYLLSDFGIETHICEIYILSLSFYPVPWMCSRDVCGNQIVPLTCFLSSLSNLCCVAWQVIVSLFCLRLGRHCGTLLAFFKVVFHSPSLSPQSSLHLFIKFCNFWCKRPYYSANVHQEDLSIKSSPRMPFAFHVISVPIPHSSSRSWQKDTRAPA